MMKTWISFEDSVLMQSQHLHSQSGFLSNWELSNWVIENFFEYHFSMKMFETEKNAVKYIETMNMLYALSLFGLMINAPFIEKTEPVHEHWGETLVWIITSLPSDLTLDDDCSSFITLEEFSLWRPNTFTYPREDIWNSNHIKTSVHWDNISNWCAFPKQYPIMRYCVFSSKMKWYTFSKFFSWKDGTNNLV